MGRALEFDAYAKQAEALRYLFDDTTRNVGYGGGAGGGKSYIGCFWTWFMCNKYKGVRYFWGRNELKRLKETTYVSYQEFCENYKIPSKQAGYFSEAKSTITFENGSKILMVDLKFLPSDELGKRFGSMLLTGGFIDESYEVDIRYVNMIKTRVGRWKNAEYNIFPKVLETFNPDKGHVYSKYYLPSVNGTLPDNTKFIKALAIDRLTHQDYFIKHLKLHPEDKGTAAGIYVESLLEMEEAIQQRLLWGNFEYDDDPTRLIDFNSILGLFVPGKQDAKGERCITADVALRGNDKFVICVWYGKALIEHKVIPICGGREVVEVIKEMSGKHMVPAENIIYDADGLGGFIGGEGGFIEEALPFRNGSKPRIVKKENFDNLKSLCGYKFAEAVNAGEYFFFSMRNDLAIQERVKREFEQLRGVRMGDDLKTKGLVNKDEMKRLLGFSPDILDACLMREYLPYARKKYSGEADYA